MHLASSPLCCLPSDSTIDVFFLCFFITKKKQSSVLVKTNRTEAPCASLRIIHQTRVDLLGASWHFLAHFFLWPSGPLFLMAALYGVIGESAPMRVVMVLHFVSPGLIAPNCMRRPMAVSETV